MANRVSEILSWYKSDNPGVLNNLARLMNHGKLAGTGKLVILPVDQGFEHGPARSFAPNAAGYDPHYHFQLGIESGCNAYAAPLGFLEQGAVEFAGQIPMILKLNNHDVLQDEKDPLGAVTSSIKDALRLGCAAVGYTIYPGTMDRRLQYQEVAELILEAKSSGLPMVMWSYPRGGGLSKNGETGLDVTAYAAQIACQLGAHIVKVKLPTDHVEQPEAQKVYDKYKIPKGTLAERVKHVVQSCFNGKRVVIFSGGAKKENDEDIYSEAKAIRDGGGFGSIMGRNAFQREKGDALKLLGKIMSIYKGE